MEEEFIIQLTSLIKCLRKSPIFTKEFGLCPLFVETRWISLSSSLTWLVDNRVAVKEFVDTQRENRKPSNIFWVLIFIAHTFMDTIETSFKRLQGLETTVSEQEDELRQLAEELKALSYMQEVDDLAHVPESDEYRLGSLVMRITDAVEVLVDQGTTCSNIYSSLSDEDQDLCLEEIMMLFVQAVYNIDQIVVTRTKENDADKLSLPTLPLELMEVHPKSFYDLVTSQRERLNVSFKDQEIECIEEEFKKLRRLHFKDKALVQQLKIVEKSKHAFTASWQLLGEDFQSLHIFVAAFASIFANTATVEADFSIISYEKDDNRRWLTDFSLEGILQAKQFDKLNGLRR